MSIQSLDVIGPTNKIGSGEVDHLEIFSSQMAKLCMSEEFSDVTFEIEDEMIHGHVNILVTRSKYFRALLCGDFAESKQKVIQMKVPIEAFKTLLAYIYLGHLSLSEMSAGNILDTLHLVHQYGFTELGLSIIEYLCEIVSLDNVCTIVDTARVLGLEKLQNDCYTFLDTNANTFLVHESFRNLSEETLKAVISRDTFCAPESKIFTAVCDWCKYNPNVATESVVSLVRLPLMSFEELFEIVQQSGVLDTNSFLNAIKQKSTLTSLEYRRGQWQEKNVATEKFGARVTQYECGLSLINGDTTSYDLNKGYARHGITDDNYLGIIVELGSAKILNHIKLLLLDRDSRCYSYFIDVSVDNTQWERVVDHQPYHCRSWQFLYFPTRDVRYIKVVGTYGSKQPMFEVVSLEAYYTAKVPKMINGVVAPTKNVATIEMGATVIGNESLKPNNLIIGDSLNHVAHSINNGSIIVQLSQPYIIGSMRLFLYDNEKYSFYIETSTNQKDWEVVVDKQKEDCRSWQDLEFEPRVMVFIKIVGTSAEDRYFRCVHFECPSQILNVVDNNHNQEEE